MGESSMWITWLALSNGIGQLGKDCLSLWKVTYIHIDARCICYTYRLFVSSEWNESKFPCLWDFHMLILAASAAGAIALISVTEFRLHVVLIASRNLWEGQPLPHLQQHVVKLSLDFHLVHRSHVDRVAENAGKLTSIVSFAFLFYFPLNWIFMSVGFWKVFCEIQYPLSSYLHSQTDHWKCLIICLIIFQKVRKNIFAKLANAICETWLCYLFWILLLWPLISYIART